MAYAELDIFSVKDSHTIVSYLVGPDSTEEELQCAKKIFERRSSASSEADMVPLLINILALRLLFMAGADQPLKDTISHEGVVKQIIAKGCESKIGVPIYHNSSKDTTLCDFRFFYSTRSFSFISQETLYTQNINRIHSHSMHGKCLAKDRLPDELPGYYTFRDIHCHGDIALGRKLWLGMNLKSVETLRLSHLTTKMEDFTRGFSVSSRDVISSPFEYLGEWDGNLHFLDVMGKTFFSKCVEPDSDIWDCHTLENRCAVAFTKHSQLCIQIYRYAGGGEFLNIHRFESKGPRKIFGIKKIVQDPTQSHLAYLGCDDGSVYKVDLTTGSVMNFSGEDHKHATPLVGLWVDGDILLSESADCEPNSYNERFPEDTIPGEFKFWDLKTGLCFHKSTQNGAKVCAFKGGQLVYIRRSILRVVDFLSPEKCL